MIAGYQHNFQHFINLVEERKKSPKDCILLVDEKIQMFSVPRTKEFVYKY